MRPLEDEASPPRANWRYSVRSIDAAKWGVLGAEHTLQTSQTACRSVGNR